MRLPETDRQNRAIVDVISSTNVSPAGTESKCLPWRRVSQSLRSEALRPETEDRRLNEINHPVTCSWTTAWFKTSSPRTPCTVTGLFPYRCTGGHTAWGGTLTPACRSSDLSMRSSSLSPRARIRSTFCVMMFFTPSTWSLKTCTLSCGSAPTPPRSFSSATKTQRRY